MGAVRSTSGCLQFLPQFAADYGCGKKDGQTVLLEEYIQGDTLGEILKGGLLATAEAKRITRQLCSALWVLHSMGVVHRDVKPDNVIIRGQEAVLIDFDASRVYKNAMREDTQILGTTGVRSAGAVWTFSVGWTGRYLRARCAAQYHADG